MPIYMEKNKKNKSKPLVLVGCMVMFCGLNIWPNIYIRYYNVVACIVLYSTAKYRNCGYLFFHISEKNAYPVLTAKCYLQSIFCMFFLFDHLNILNVNLRVDG